MNKPGKLPFDYMAGMQRVIAGPARPAPRPAYLASNDKATASISPGEKDTAAGAPKDSRRPEKISWARLCELYELNERLMDDALQRLLAAPLTYRPFPPPRRQRQAAAGAQIVSTGRFFSHIAGLGGKDRTRRIVRACNRRLFYVRLCERVALANTDTEFAHLQMLYAAKKFGTLRAALREYHDRRFESLPCVMKLI